MLIIGDVHGKRKQYYKITRKHSCSIQLGDLGVGFIDIAPPEGHYFIHGNHDNPDICENIGGFLGRYGYFNQNIWFCSGAESIDRHLRYEGVNWWRNEELSYLEMNRALEEYSGADIILSHDCPLSFYSNIISHHIKPSKTAQFLDAILEKSKPKIWLFGHHHTSINIMWKNVQMICLKELETFEV